MDRCYGRSIVSSCTVCTRSLWNTREGDRRMAPVTTFLRPVICSLVGTLLCGMAAVRAQPVVATTRDAFVHPNLIVSVSWLKQHTTDPHLRLVDARPTAEYTKGHIPGAVSLPVADTFDPAQPKNYPDTKQKLEVLFASRGLSNTTRIIIYDNGKETLSARLFWPLQCTAPTHAAVPHSALTH